GRSDGMNEQRLLGRVELGGLAKRRVEREEAVELRSGRIGGKVPASAGERGIAGRRDDRQPVGGTALDDEDEAALRVGSRERHARIAERGERSSGAAR